MKKSILILVLSALSFCGFSQNTPTLYFKINAPVITTDGRIISANNAVVSFLTHPEGITNATMPCDLNWWISASAQDSGYAKITPTSSLFNGVVFNVAYLDVTVPAQQFSYLVFQGWAKAWLESKYGSGKVIILN